MSLRRDQAGFTLIELLVVIAVIGFLAAAVFAALNIARGKARDTKRKADMAQLRKALDIYYQDNNGYPTYAACQGSNGDDIQGLASYVVPKYVSALANDPGLTGTPNGFPNNYAYACVAGGKDYGLYIPFSNDTNLPACKLLTSSTMTAWSSTPDCTY